eukprot:901932_1
MPPNLTPIKPQPSNLCPTVPPLSLTTIIAPYVAASKAGTPGTSTTSSARTQHSRMCLFSANTFHIHHSIQAIILAPHLYSVSLHIIEHNHTPNNTNAASHATHNL